MDEQDHDRDVVAFVAGNRSVTIGLAVVVAVFGLLWLVIITQVFLDGGEPSTSESTPTTVASAAALSTAPSASNEITVPTSDIAGAPPTTLSADTTTPIAPAGPSELLPRPLRGVRAFWAPFLAANATNGTQKVMHTQEGATTPVRWA